MPIETRRYRMEQKIVDTTALKEAIPTAWWSGLTLADKLKIALLAVIALGVWV